MIAFAEVAKRRVLERYRMLPVQGGIVFRQCRTVTIGPFHLWFL